MNYFSFHIGDYAAHTKHLSLIEDLAYRRMLDLYYTNEKSLPVEPEKVARLIGMREYMQEVSNVLSDFFLKTEDGYISKRCDEEISRYHAKAERAKQANKARWGEEKSNPDVKSDLKSESVQIPTNNQEPRTNKKNTSSVAGATTYPEEFETAWSEYPDRPGASKKKAFKAWSARVKEGITADQLLKGVRAYAAYVAVKKTEPDFIKQPATFFGPDQHFDANWFATADGASYDLPVWER